MNSNYSMQTKGIQFNSLKEIQAFVKMTETDQSNVYVDAVKEDIIIIGKEADVYYYNESTRLWDCVTKEVYSAFIPEFFNISGKNLKKAFAKYAVLDEDDDDDDNGKYAKLKKDVSKIIDKFDKTTYHASIEKRSTGKLQNNNFVKKLNTSPHMFPILNGRKIDLRTLEISQRQKVDYFTFESPVDFVTETPNADRFFNEVFTNETERNYMRKTLGYSITGETMLQVFYIWYGKGRNGKSVLTKVIKKIMTGTYFHQCDKSIFVKTSKQQVHHLKKWR